MERRRLRIKGRGERNGEACTGFYCGNLREMDSLGDRHICEDNIKTNLQEVGCRCMGWIELARKREGCWALMKAVEKLRVS
jgi:hypothetical protein